MLRIHDASSISLSWWQPDVDVFFNASVLVFLSLLKQVNVQGPLSMCHVPAAAGHCLKTFILHTALINIPRVKKVLPVCLVSQAAVQLEMPSMVLISLKPKTTRKYQEKIRYSNEAQPGLVSHQMALLGCGVALRMRSHDKARRQSLARGEPLALRVVQAT